MLYFPYSTGSNDLTLTYIIALFYVIYLHCQNVCDDSLSSNLMAYINIIITEMSITKAILVLDCFYTAFMVLWLIMFVEDVTLILSLT